MSHSIPCLKHCQVRKIMAKSQTDTKYSDKILEGSAKSGIRSIYDTIIYADGF